MGEGDRRGRLERAVLQFGPLSVREGCGGTFEQRRAARQRLAAGIRARSVGRLRFRMVNTLQLARVLHRGGKKNRSGCGWSATCVWLSAPRRLLSAREPLLHVIVASL